MNNGIVRANPFHHTFVNAVLNFFRIVSQSRRGVRLWICINNKRLKFEGGQTGG